MSGKALKQAQLPFKTMNIKSALQVSSGSQRKRKSSEPHHNPKDAKTFKTNLSQTDDEQDHESKEEVENLQTNVFNYEDSLNAENCKKTLQAFFKTSNKNCSEESVRVRQALSEPNNIKLIAKKTIINHIKQENSEDLEIIAIIGNGEINAVESNEQKISVDNKDETPNIERSLNISNSIDNDSIISVSSDELESSMLNSSTQSASASAKMSCDSSEDNKSKLLKVNAHIQPNVDEMKDCTNENLTATGNKSEIGAANVQKDIPRKRKRMSVEGARIKTLQRLKVEEEKEQKKIQRLKELEAKKEAKRLKNEQKLKERMEMKEKLLLEKQKRKEKEEMERKEKQRLKMEKRDQEEKERLQKLQEKEEKNKLKQQLLEAKAEEKKKKEEERQKFLEEKKKAEEEEEKKREKTKAAFVNFFVKTKTSELPRVNEPEGAFRPFQVTNGMVLAPVVPEIAQARFDRKLLEKFLLNQDNLTLYLEELEQGKHQSFKYKKNQNKKEIEVDDDVIILDFDDKEEQTENFNLRPKLLQFCENVRPPYWGTWRKKSQAIRPRNPFGREALFDYDIDSDDEWDEGGPGESLSGTEDEESEDDYEVDNEFFVPHGYLSADEEKDEDNTVDSPELHHARLKAKEYEFEAERCKKTIELKPCIIGCFWEISTISGNQHLQRALQIYSAEILIKRPIETSFSLAKAKVDENTSILLSPESTSPAGENSSQKRLAKATSKQPVPEEAMPYLIQLLHASTHGRSRVIKEFQEFWLLQHKKKDNDNSCKETLNNSFTSPRSPTSPRTGNKEHVSEKCENTTPKMSNIRSGKISKRQLEITMQKICIWCKCPSSVINKYCWWVHDEVREKYGLTDLPVPNKWQFVSRKDVGNFQPVSQPVANIGTPSIKNFLHV